MVKVTFRRSPNYFKQFQKQLKYLLVDKKSNVTALNNYAHFESEFCQLPTNRFQVLIASGVDAEIMTPIKTFAAPCLFANIRNLFSTLTSLEISTRYIFKTTACRWRSKQIEEKMDTAYVRNRIPPLAVAATKLPKSTEVTSGIPKTFQKQHQLYHRKQLKVLCVLQFFRKINSFYFRRFRFFRRFRLRINSGDKQFWYQSMLVCVLQIVCLSYLPYLPYLRRNIWL